MSEDEFGDYEEKSSYKNRFLSVFTTALYPMPSKFPSMLHTNRDPGSWKKVPY